MSVRLPDQLPQVTPRQFEVAHLVARGLTNPQIAEELGITLDGAKYHVAELLGRLELSKREEIAGWYREQQRAQRLQRVRQWLAPLGWTLAGSTATVAVLLLAVALRGSSILPGAERATVPAPSVDAEGRLDFAPDTKFTRDGERWSRAFVGSSTALAAPNLAPAADGGIFVGATFGTEETGGRIDLGGGPLMSAGAWDGVLARLAPDGAHVWSRRVGGLDLDTVGAGRYTGAVDLGTGPLGDGGTTPTTWLARFAGDGSTVWSRTFARGRVDVAAVTMLGDDIIVAGTFAGTVDVSGRSLAASGARDLLVASFDRDGALRWLKAAGGDGSEQGVAIASSGDRIVLAVTLGRVVDTNSLQPGYREADLLLIALGRDGSERWRRTLTGQDTALAASGLAVAEDGSSVVAATLRGRVDLDGNVLESAGPTGRDIMLIRVDREGRHLWSRRFGTSNDDAVLALAASKDGFYLSGVFRGRLDLGGQAIVSSLNSDGLPSQNGFLAHLTFDGEHVSSRVFGAPRSDRAQELLVGAHGDLFATGHFLGLIDVGSGRLVSTQSFLDSFIAKVEP